MIRNPKDTIGAALSFLAGLIWLVHGLSYPMGSMVRMGSGFFPVLLGAVTIILSGFLLIRAVTVEDSLEPVLWRPFAAICAALAAFGIVLLWFGLGPAIVATVLISSLADPSSRPLGTVVLAAVLTIGTWLIFIVGLGMTVPLFRAPF